MNTDLNKTIIITGVTGQMGSWLSDFCLKKGMKVIGAVRRLSVPNTTNIKHIDNPNFILEIMDLGDVHSINSIIQKYKPDYFVNCAANSFVGTSWKCPEQHFEFNALGVLRQLEAIRQYSPQTRYLNFGSSEEFGDVQYNPQDENHPPRARSPYGASKVAARQIVKVYRDSYGLYAIQPWCFNYESERRGEEFVTRKITKGVARIVQAIRDKQPFEPIKLGNIYAKRDWSHAEDFVDGIWRMLNQDKYNSNFQVGEEEFWTRENVAKQLQEYVLASGETHTIKEFIDKAFFYGGFLNSTAWTGEGLNEKLAIANHLMDTTHLESRTLIEIDPTFYRPAEVELLLGNSAQAEKDLGWERKISFDNLVKRMVESDLYEIGFKPALPIQSHKN